MMFYDDSVQFTKPLSPPAPHSCPMYEFVARDMEWKVPILSQKLLADSSNSSSCVCPSLFIAAFAQARENKLYVADMYLCIE